MQLIYTGSEEDSEANEDFAEKSEDAALSSQYEEHREDPRTDYGEGPSYNEEWNVDDANLCDPGLN